MRKLLVLNSVAVRPKKLLRSEEVSLLKTGFCLEAVLLEYRRFGRPEWFLFCPPKLPFPLWFSCAFLIGEICNLWRTIYSCLCQY